MTIHRNVTFDRVSGIPGPSWTSDPPVSSLQVLGLYVCATTPYSCGTGDQTQGSVCARWALYKLSYIPSLEIDFFCMCNLFYLKMKSRVHKNPYIILGSDVESPAEVTDLGERTQSNHRSCSQPFLLLQVKQLEKHGGTLSLSSFRFVSTNTHIYSLTIL